VVIGVATSIITLAVMTGFQGYFRDKILSAMPHIVVMEYTGAGVKDVESLRDKVARVPHVKATTPFVYGQSMVTTRSACRELLSGVLIPKLKEP